MNLANTLTLSRIALAPVFLWFVNQDDMAMRWFAFITFLLAAITDYYDGWVARRYKEVSNFGKILDPVADKILVASALIVLVILDRIPLWMVIVILGREFLITSIRVVAMTQNQVLASQKSGKQKTISQLVAILVMLFAMAMQATAQQLPLMGQWLKGQSVWASVLYYFISYGPYWLMLIAVIFSITSGGDFVWKNRSLFKRSLL